ncbi:hypothetical protein FGO68_gene4756 [Halteria grandinella]|uniref:Uncharacterized protein n=1 Tax=Halteria grandinella TaxID=5974 RepID=A0A8J8SX69_HALGN|nr:hypothetical protein FGO68_gene4756 [Halteria grandinella]
MLRQVQQMEMRMAKLQADKDIAEREYGLKINGQEDQIKQFQSHLSDIQKNVSQKDQENKELTEKLNKTKGSIEEAESEYAKLREQNSDVVRKNKVIKAELGVLQQSLRHENDLDTDNLYRLEVTKKNLVKTTEEIQYQISKEEQLLIQIKEKHAQIEELDRKSSNFEIMLKDTQRLLDELQSDLMRERTKQSLKEHDLPTAQRDIDRLADQKNQLLLRLRHNELQESEMAMRIDELQEKYKRREEEVEELIVDVERIKEGCIDLMQVNERLHNERDQLIKAADRIVDANSVIEKEIEEILQHDETIRQSLEIRDRKLSPVIHQTKQHALILQERLNISLSHQSAQNSQPTAQVGSSLLLSHLQEADQTKQQDQSAVEQQHSQRGDIRSCRWTTFTKESPINQSFNTQLRYLNPRNLKENSSNNLNKSAYKEPQSAVKHGSSPLRYRHQ